MKDATNPSVEAIPQLISKIRIIRVTIKHGRDMGKIIKFMSP